MIGWMAYTEARTLLARPQRMSVTEADLHRWFGPQAPPLYHSSFGTETGLPFDLDHHGTVGSDPRLRWEGERDQEISSLMARVTIAGWGDRERQAVADQADRTMGAAIPNAMEAALRCVTWLEAARFIARDSDLATRVLPRLSRWLLRTGAFIERRLHEVPLGGNHYLSHAAGLLYLGRLLPGRRETERWARRSQRILEHEVVRQFHRDGGSYEQSTAYHLFALDLVIGCALLLRGQGVDLSSPARERLHLAARAAATLVRPDGSIPILGDDDSGRVHRWGADPTARELCALAALLLDDPDLALAAGGGVTAASWLMGAGAPRRLEDLAATGKPPATATSLQRTGLHVLRTTDLHATLWSRDPSSPAMLSHGHSDHNSVDVWAFGSHIVRDPGSGMYVGDPRLRNLLRTTAAHSTLTVDEVEVSPFDPRDLFFIPPSTRGRRLEWNGMDHLVEVATTHDGFRRVAGHPSHRRRVRLDVDHETIEIVDVVDVLSPGRHRITAWWYWGNEPEDVRSRQADGLTGWVFRVGACAIELEVPAGAKLTVAEPFPWSPRYGVVESGRRSVVRYEGPLPFLMTLRLTRAVDLA